MTPFEICTLVLTAVLALLGGAWTLIKAQTTLQQRLQNHKNDALEKSIRHLEKLLERIDEKVTTLDRKWTDQFALFSEKINNLRVILNEVTRETQNARLSLVDGTKSFADSIRRLVNERSDVEDLGNGMFRVKGNKKKDGV